MRDNKWRLWRFGLELLTGNQASPCFVLRVKSEEEAGGSIIAFSMTWLNATGDNVTSTNKTSGLNVISTTPAKTVASSLVNSPVVPMHLCKVLQIMTWKSKATRKTTAVIRYDMLVLINVSLEVMAVQSELNHPAPSSIYTMFVTINPVPLHSCHLSMATVCVVTNMCMFILLAAVKKCSGVQHENSLSALLFSICTKINI